MVRGKFDVDEMSKRAEDALENHATSSNPTRSAGRRGSNNRPALKREANTRGMTTTATVSVTPKAPTAEAPPLKNVAGEKPQSDGSSSNDISSSSSSASSSCTYHNCLTPDVADLASAIAVLDGAGFDGVACMGYPASLYVGVGRLCDVIELPNAVSSGAWLGHVAWLCCPVPC